jgi:hypothetical protein
MSAERSDSPAARSSGATILAGGLALIVAAVAFLVVFSYLAARFNYPEVLDGAAADVLPALLATGAGGRMAWAVYSVLPLLFIPASIGAFEALRGRSEGPMRVAMFSATVAAISMVLGLMRWSSIQWELARAWALAEPGQKATLSAVFDGLNRYLGNYIGEFLGELSFNVFFLLTAAALLRYGRRWLGSWGMVTGVLGLIGMWRNVTPAVQPVAEVNNYLLPLWMLGLGAWLALAGRRAAR